MTRLMYKVGNAEMVSYKMACELKRRTGLPIQKVYIEINEELDVNPEQREKRANAIHNKARAAR